MQNGKYDSLSFCSLQLRVQKSRLKNGTDVDLYENFDDSCYSKTEKNRSIGNWTKNDEK